jgi:hypothetical protein
MWCSQHRGSLQDSAPLQYLLEALFNQAVFETLTVFEPLSFERVSRL